MNYPRYLLAKYVPDIDRMEPRNIGVFLWVRGEVRAKFLNCDEATFVPDKKTYNRWITFWERIISQDEFRPIRAKPFLRKDPDFLDAILTTQKGEFLLVSAGELVDQIKKKDAPAAIDFLFDELVAIRHAQGKDQASRVLGAACNQVFVAAGVPVRPSFPLECPIYGVRKHVKFSYGVPSRTAMPHAVFQRVNIANDISTHNAALLLQSAIMSAILEESRCAVLYQSSAEDTVTRNENLALLSSICRAIDVDDLEQAQKDVQKIAA